MTTSPLREVRISAVENGFIVFPRETYGRPGEMTGTYVFSTVDEMTTWLNRQVWQFGVGPTSGGDGRG